VYPVENAGLADEIAKKGLRISEQPCGLDPQARHFPLRNRIISGLSKATIVVEAAARSGSLITARLALEQGREVLAVPGHPFDGRASGCNMLIRDGATLARNVDDVLEIVTLGAPSKAATDTSTDAMPRNNQPHPTAALPPDHPAGAPRDWRDMAALHDRILNRLGPSPLAEDQLIRDLALPPAAIAPELLTLELEGRIARHSGGLLSRVN
ncbi:MAG: DNA-processing protein DprA, partial [Albidovulum sp.]